MQDGIIESGGVLLRKRRGYDNTFDAVIEELQSDSDEEEQSQQFGKRKRKLDESGLPMIPELLKYNDLFELTNSKKRKKDRERIYEVFNKI